MNFSPLARAAAVVVALMALVGEALPAQPRLDPCRLPQPPRIVAVGDVHGAYDNFVAILRAAGIIDRRERWAGGSAYLVQTGDVLDRGADSRKVLDLLRKLEREAPRAGGRVVALLGNHEVMRMLGDNRDVSAGEIEAFKTSRSIELRQHVRNLWLEQQRTQAEASGTAIDEHALIARFEQQTPLGFIEMSQALSASGDYGKWLRERPAMARLGRIVFMHGGASPRIAALGCEAVNAGVRRELTEAFDATRQNPLETLSGSEDGPLWYRGLAQQDEAAFAPTLEQILTALDAEAIVVGHTVSETGRIRPRFGRKVVQIDTGMLTSVYKGGRPSALEIAGDRWTAIYEDGKEPLTSLTP